MKIVGQIITLGVVGLIIIVGLVGASYVVISDFVSLFN